MKREAVRKDYEEKERCQQEQQRAHDKKVAQDARNGLYKSQSEQKIEEDKRKEEQKKV